MKKEQLKSWRKSKGMTQHEFSEYIGVKPRTVQNWELGAYDIPEYVQRIHDITVGEDK